jgi:hypothetical protein
MMRWIRRIVVGAAIAFAACYGVDWTVFSLRHSPTSTVNVNRYLVVPLKGSKSEYDYLGSGDEPCSISLFPRAGMPACWQLRRNTNQVTNL